MSIKYAYMILTRTVVVKEPADAGLNDLKLAGSAFVTVSLTIFWAAAGSIPSAAFAANVNFATALTPSALVRF